METETQTPLDESIALLERLATESMYPKLAPLLTLSNEVARLKALNHNLSHELSLELDAKIAAVHEAETAERELAAAREDGERYRHLRDKSVGQWEHPIVVTQDEKRSPRYIGPLIGKELDTAIDAARSKSHVPVGGSESLSVKSHQAALP